MIIWSNDFGYGPIDAARAANKYQAKKLAPWASRVATTSDGWIAFESIQDYQTWKKQK